MGMPSVHEEGVYFPEFERVPESRWHLELRTLVYQFLKHAFADRASVGCDQFLYWNRRDPRLCLAPDAFLHFGEPDRLFRTWKVWERGAPQLAIEIISETDRDADWAAKLEKFQTIGVLELLRFDPDADEQPLRVWIRRGQELVEQDPRLQSPTTLGYWQVFEDATLERVLRLSRDPEGKQLYLTPFEEEVLGRSAAERRIRELEAELARR